MWAFFGAAIATLSVVIGVLYQLARWDRLRTISANRPDMIQFWIVRFIDRLLEMTVLRSLFSASSTQKTAKTGFRRSDTPSSPIRSLHDFGEVEGVVSIRQSFSVTVDLSTSIPPFFLRWLGGTFFLPYLMGASVTLAVGGVLPIVVLLENDLVRGIGGSICMLVGILVATVVANADALNTLRLINITPYWTLTIDDKFILSESTFGGRWAARNSPKFAFETITDRSVLGIGTNMGRIAFTFPRSFEAAIMDEAALQTLCTRLNSLADSARNLPAVAYDQIPFPSEAAPILAAPS